MRKIEAAMNRAARNRVNWQSGNTRVEITPENDALVYLHSNLIGKISQSVVTLYDGGWQSNTTKSRLNALCYEFAYGTSVFQKNWEWFVSTSNGSDDFISGYEVAI